MAEPRPRRKCPDCDGPLAEIRLIDRGDKNSHKEFGYTAASAKRGFFGMGAFPLEGTLKGYVCRGCARVLLYAAPKPKKSV